MTARDPEPSGRIVFLGQNDMGGEALATLVRLGIRPSLVLTRPPKSHRNGVDAIVNRYGLTALMIDSVHSCEAISAITQVKAEVGVCCGWSERLSPELLGIPLHGWLNLHPSELPRWRGSNPIGWQIASGNSEICCSVHWMALRLDAGPVLERGTVRVGCADTGGSLRIQCGRRLGRLAARAVARVIAGAGGEGTVQDEAEATYCPPRGMLLQFISHETTTQDARRMIRAFSPYPGVVALVDGVPFRVIVNSPEPVGTAALELTIPCIDGEIRACVLQEGE